MATRRHVRPTLAAALAMAATACLALAAASPAHATNFAPNQNASLQLGAPGFTTPSNNKYLDRTFERPGGMLIDGSGRIWLADPGTNRIARFNSMPASDGAPFDMVVGQPGTADFRSGCSQTRMLGPKSVSIGGGRMVVADTANHRILLYDSVPTSNGAAASRVLGRYASFTQCGSGTSRNRLNRPGAVWTDGNKILVVDNSNDRVMVWDSWPTTNAQNADRVLGQDSWTSSTANNPNLSEQARFSDPMGVWSDGTRILVTDDSNDRVYVWTSWPTMEFGQAANHMIGTSTWTSTGSGCSATRVNSPSGAWSVGSDVFVADSGNNRVLVFGGYDWASNTPTATRVLGQTGFTSCGINRGSTTLDGVGLDYPETVWSDGTRILVSDTYRNRVLVWTSFPASNGAAPQRVLGQVSTSRSGEHGFGLDNTFQYVGTSGTGYYQGAYPFINPLGGLITTVSAYNRTTIHTSDPTTNDQDPDLVLGQDDAVSNFCNGILYALAANGTNGCSPMGVWTDGTRLLITEQWNHRVKVWNSFPTTPNQPPDLVLGQTSFTSSSAGVSTMNRPAGVASDGTRIFVSDMLNHRVLVWNSWPTTNGQAPDLVLGQPDFTSSTSNNGGISAQTLSYPDQVAIDAGRLAVADNGNNRVLIWATLPTTTREAATAVVGQTSFTASSSSTDTYWPTGVALADNTLFWAGWCGAYYLDPVPTSGAVSTGWSAVGTPCAGDTPTASAVHNPSGIAARAGKVWIGNDGTARLSRFDDVTSPTITLSPTITTGCTGVTVTWSTSESGTAEVYWGPTSQATVGGYPNSSIRTQADGLTQQRTISGLAPGTYYYRVRTADGAGNAVVSSESTFTVTATVGSMFSHDSNAQSGATNNIALTSPTPRLSFVNNTGCPASRQRTQVVTTPLDSSVVELWRLDGSGYEEVSGETMSLEGSPAYSAGQPSFQQALSGDGTSGLRRPYQSRFALDVFTLELWFRTNTLANAAYPVLFHNGGATTSRNYVLHFDRSLNRLYGSLSASGVKYEVSRSAATLVDGHWHHVAMTVDASKTMRMYIDGELVSTATYSGTIDKPTSEIRIGYSGCDCYFQGDIDDVRISNVARSGAEIAGYYRSRQPHFRTMWDSDATDAGISQTSCATTSRCADVTYGMGGSSAELTGGRYYARQKLRETAVSAWSPWSSWDWFEQRLGRPVNLYTDNTNAQTGVANRTDISSATPRLSWMNTSGTTVDRQRTQVRAAPPGDVIGMWHLDRDGTDTSANANPFALAAAPATPTWVPGQAAFGEALSFDGNDYAQAATNAAYDQQEFTVSTWFNTSDITTSQFSLLAGRFLYGPYRSQFWVGFQRATNELGAEVTTNNATWNGMWIPGSQWVDGNWHHLAYVVKGNQEIILYVDGVEVGRTAISGTVDTPAAPVEIGGTSKNSTENCTCLVDELRIINRALSEQEIVDYVNAGLPSDIIWDSDTSDAGIPLTSCADLTRCADIAYGSGGTPSGGTPLIRDGARYYARAKLRAGAGAWSLWSDWDWFETTPTVTVTLPDGPNATFSPSPLMPGATATTTVDVDVATSNAAGYTLTATNASDTDGLANGAHAVPPWTGTPGTPTSWAAGTVGYFGMTVLSATGGKDTDRWGTGTTATDYANLLYAGPLLSQSTLLHRRTTWSAGTDRITTAFRIGAAASQRAGTYTTTLTFTATANP